MTKLPPPRGSLGFVGHLAQRFIDSKTTLLLILVALLMGLGALFILPREEEPQISVPMADIFVQMPGASAAEIEQRVTYPLENLIREIPGIEYVYSTSSADSALVIARFQVGQDSETSITQLYTKLYSNLDRIPPGASQPLIKPRSIDDVAVLTLTLWSDQADGFILRQTAAQLKEQIKAVPTVSQVHILGGQIRTLRVDLDPVRLSSYGLTPLQITSALGAANTQPARGDLTEDNHSLLVRTDGFLTSAQAVENLVVATGAGRPVYLRDVATVTDGPAPPDSYVFYGQKGQGEGAAVTLAVAKLPRTNAIQMSAAVRHKLELIRPQYIPANVHLTVTRDDGRAAAERSNQLLWHMGIAVVSVTLLMALALGQRAAKVTAVAIPVTLALTLASFLAYGFTLNRVSFFALIFSIGILVDDAIVVVENVGRHLQLPESQNRLRSAPQRRSVLRAIILEAVDEVGNPTILATLTVIAAILPMAFVRGLMGPYMRPIPLGASAAMVFSLLVAFIIVPWVTLRVFADGHNLAGHEQEDALTQLYRRLMYPLIHFPRRGVAFLVTVTVVLVLILVTLVGFKLVILKMLPSDNKSQLEVLVTLPAGTALEKTALVTQEMTAYLETVPDVLNYQRYVGLAAPYNFNGLVRHYFLRSGPNVADLVVNLVPASERHRQSHAVAELIRPSLAALANQYGARIQVTESPPGPPVLDSLVTEVYGPDYAGQIALAREIFTTYKQTPGVVDVDWYVQAPQREYHLVIDRQKAALNGVTVAAISQTLQTSLNGTVVGILHDPTSREDVDIRVRLAIPERSRVEDLGNIPVQGSDGRLVPLSALTHLVKATAPQSIYHKNLEPVVYVLGDVAGQIESPIYAMLSLQPQISRLPTPNGKALKTYFTEQPPATLAYAIKWDGEWQVTFEVFRDLGIAFGVVLILIYALVVGWFQSFGTPLVIMAAIPFSLIGIMPAHWLMGAFFSATSMIGFIAGAGIVVRNSIILVDFIELRLAQGIPLEEAVIDAGAVRFRPMLLTAAAVVVGSAVILDDPIFQGLAISLMAGEVASLLISRSAVPILYYLFWRRRPRPQS